VPRFVGPRTFASAWRRRRRARRTTYADGACESRRPVSAHRPPAFRAPARGEYEVVPLGAAVRGAGRDHVVARYSSGSAATRSASSKASAVVASEGRLPIRQGAAPRRRPRPPAVSGGGEKSRPRALIEEAPRSQPACSSLARPRRVRRPRGDEPRSNACWPRAGARLAAERALPRFFSVPDPRQAVRPPALRALFGGNLRGGQRCGQPTIVGRATASPSRKSSFIS